MPKCLAPNHDPLQGNRTPSSPGFAAANAPPCAFARAVSVLIESCSQFSPSEVHQTARLKRLRQEWYVGQTVAISAVRRNDDYSPFGVPISDAQRESNSVKFTRHFYIRTDELKA